MDFLSTTVAQARERVAEARRARPLSRPLARPFEGRCARQPAAAAPGRRAGRLVAAITAGSRGPGTWPVGNPALIAEIKRSSPSKGAIAPGLDAVARARAYAAAGADAVSVLTEAKRFGGSLEDLAGVAAAVSLPVLRKDFVVDPYQVWEASDAGAAAVLLIVGALSDDDLSLLLTECQACDLDALVEVHDEVEMKRAAAAGAELIGINNRNLQTLTVDLRVTERLAARAPEGALLVSESGVTSADDARRLACAGARALLVGEALVRAPRERLAEMVWELKGRPLPKEAPRP
jgi:indole-3-glycerol phosphate synthase